MMQTNEKNTQLELDMKFYRNRKTQNYALTEVHVAENKLILKKFCDLF